MANIAIDFVGPLPTNKGFDCVLTITDRVLGYVRLLPTRFHEGWHRLFSLPQSIVLDCDKLFTSKFWATLHKCLNVKLQLSSAFHPEMDGRSKKTNKTAFQILRALINKEQSNWMECLAVCEYAINSSLNVATGKTPFELVLGYMPSLAPLARATDDKELPLVEELLSLRFQACEYARDQLAMSKVRQAVQSNKRRQDEPSWAVGDLVLLDSSDRRKRLHTHQRRTAKLMDRFDGPYCIVKAQPEISSYTLQLNGDNTAVPFFHTGKLKTYHENNATLFPNHEPAWPGPMDVGGEPGYVTEDIVNERTRAGKRQYLVLWVSWPSDSDSWEPAEALDDTEALDRWEHWNEDTKPQVVSDQKIAKLVLLGTNPELCRVLRTHAVSTLAVWSDLSLETLALNVPKPPPNSLEDNNEPHDAPSVQPTEFNYQVFEGIGRDTWSIITQCQRAIALQVTTLQQRPQVTYSCSVATPVATSAQSSPSPAGGPCSQLTNKERAYLDQNNGCYCCCAINNNHLSCNCPCYTTMGAPTASSTTLSTTPAPHSGSPQTFLSEDFVQ
ncbi:BQ2448_6232 [Microbotryum intermedium]|uniref:BQ2448_6232 protein n=1 Tax=Microbotryum intermedium TaxID=269621 RepID=A0A238FJ44_9BASI|nr:BQ2448_6232 [Microbotryum intermedium]